MTGQIVMRLIFCAEVSEREIMTNKKIVKRTIKSMTSDHLEDSLELVERVFTETAYLQGTDRIRF